jgi:hypothetical protein
MPYADKAKYNAHKRELYARNPEKIRRYRREYRAKNRERARAYDRSWYERNGAARNAWKGIKNRCCVKTSSNFANYGAKGIRLCKGWRTSRDSFIRDMKTPPQDGQRWTVDRKNNKGHYSCGKCEECRTAGWLMNCRWATYKQQMNNKSTNVLITIGTETRTVTEWAVSAGLPVESFRRRLYNGWKAAIALAKPFQKRRKIIFDGKYVTLEEGARKIGISPRSLRRRLERGWSIEDALTKPPRRL